MIYLQNRTCLNCKKFRLVDVQSGLCRHNKGITPYPVKTTEETCGKWEDAGQQYHIRLGWIKKNQETEHSRTA